MHGGEGDDLESLCDPQTPPQENGDDVFLDELVQRALFSGDVGRLQAATRWCLRASGHVAPQKHLKTIEI